MGVFRIVAIAVALFGLACCATNAQSEGSLDLDKFLANVKKKSGDLDKVRKLMKDPDQNVRLAAFDFMIQKGDQTFYNIAVSEALTSTDKLLRIRALRETLFRLDKIIVRLVPGDKRSKEMNSYIKRIGEVIPYLFKKKFPEKNCIDIYNRIDICSPGSNISISGLRVQLLYNSFQSGNFVLSEDGTLKGMFYDPSNIKVGIPAVIEIY